MIEHLDMKRYLKEALDIQAVNTVKVMPDGKLQGGFNTDYLGLMKTV